MHHRVGYLDTGRKSVEDEPPNFALKNRDQVGKFAEIALRAMNRRSEVAFETPGNLQNFFARRVLHQESCRTEDLLIQGRTEE